MPNCSSRVVKSTFTQVRGPARANQEFATHRLEPSNEGIGYTACSALDSFAFARGQSTASSPPSITVSGHRGRPGTSPARIKLRTALAPSFESFCCKPIFLPSAKPVPLRSARRDPYLWTRRNLCCCRSRLFGLVSGISPIRQNAVVSGK